MLLNLSQTFEGRRRHGTPVVVFGRCQCARAITVKEEGKDFDSSRTSVLSVIRLSLLDVLHRLIHISINWKRTYACGCATARFLVRFRRCFAFTLRRIVARFGVLGQGYKMNVLTYDLNGGNDTTRRQTGII